jgi:hypothetical protein
MQLEQSILSKLQSLCNNSSEDTKTFGVVLHNFMAEYDKNPILDHIDPNIWQQANEDMRPLQELSEATLYEMELAYYEYRDYQRGKYGKTSYPPVLNNVLDFELFRNEKMAVISHPIIGRYKILRNFVFSLEEDDSAHAKLLLKKSAILDESGIIQECIFTPNFYQWEIEYNRIAGIQQTFLWHSWNKLAHFYTNYGRMQYDLKKEVIPEFRLHMNRILQYTVESFEKKSPSKTQKVANYTVSYDPKDGLLRINETSTAFKKNADSRIVLEMLISGNKSTKKRVLTFETVSEEIVNNDHTKEDPDIYEICRSINKNVAKLGHPEFLLIKDDAVQINPKYLC